MSIALYFDLSLYEDTLQRYEPGPELGNCPPRGLSTERHAIIKTQNYVGTTARLSTSHQYLITVLGVDVSQPLQRTKTAKCLLFVDTTFFCLHYNLWNEWHKEESMAKYLESTDSIFSK